MTLQKFEKVENTKQLVKKKGIFYYQFDILRSNCKRNQKLFWIKQDDF
jgi:hypothetical protein